MGVRTIPASFAGARDRGSELYDELFERLQAIATTRRDETLARHTTFGIGGPADIYVTVRSADELAAVVLATRAAGAPYFVLGSGSNILVGDKGVRGVVIDNQAKRLEGPSESRGTWLLKAESGASFAALARQMARKGFGGIEWACGIPGSLGGAAVYNAGAYDGCLADVLRSVTMLMPDGATREMAAGDLKLTYRNSIFTRGECEGCVVLSLTLELTRGEPAALLRRIEEIDAQRLAAQPRGRTGGSTFKNPEGHHAWQLIYAVGLQGARKGDAQISEKHSNFFVNVGAARAADVFTLMEWARHRVQERFGIELENEVELVGEGFE
jgi:UDP-N-acetylmuramate dehydrogenase